KPRRLGSPRHVLDVRAEPARPSSAVAGHLRRSWSTTDPAGLCHSSRWPLPLLGCCQNTGAGLACPPNWRSLHRLLPPTGTPVFRFRQPADCRCPSPRPCPMSALYPEPLESYDSLHNRRVAPHRWTSSAALHPARAAPVGLETPAAHSSVSALLPSPGPMRPSTAGHILSARWPLQNSLHRMLATTQF